MVIKITFKNMIMKNNLITEFMEIINVNNDSYNNKKNTKGQQQKIIILVT